MWNQPRKRKLSPKKSQHLVFKKHKFETESAVNETPSPKLRRVELSANIIPINPNTFREKLKLTAPHAAFLLSDSKYKTPPSNADQKVADCDDTFNFQFHTIPFMYHNKIDLKSEHCLNHFDDYFHQLKCSKSESQLTEERTRGQTKSKYWLECRIGRVTSSNFGRICKLKQSTPADNSLKTVLNYGGGFTSKSTEWGKKHENAAKCVYSKHILNEHPNMKIEKCGLIIDPNLPHLGSSPDALLSCPHCENKEGVLEIKCPYSWRFVSPAEASKDKTFFCELLDNKPKLKTTHQYYFQVQGQMAISHRKWCDFFVWTLKGFSVERIDFDPIFWYSMLDKLNNFYISAVIPELWSERVKRGLPLFNK